MKRIPFLFMVLLLAACGGSPHPGYKEVGHDVHLCYITLGEGERLATDSDSVHVRFRVSRSGEEAGSFLSTERWYLVKDIRQGALLPVFRRLHEGDSMSVIARAASWPWAAMSGGGVEAAPDTVPLRTELSLLGIRTQRQMRADAERMRRNDPAGYERRLIEAYIARSKEPWMRWGTSDMYHVITGTAADTNRAQYRQVVHLTWTGRKLEDGTVFDEQGAGGNTFSWSYGTPDQLVQGLGTAVSLLREGQEGRFILPSALAFGEKGIPGVLEPWTPVIYTVRLVAVERAG